METFIKNITPKDSVLVIQQKEPLFSNVSESPVMSGLSQKKELFTNTSERSLNVKIMKDRCYLREDAELKIFCDGGSRIGVLCIICHCKVTFFIFSLYSVICLYFTGNIELSWTRTSSSSAADNVINCPRSFSSV